MVKLPMCRICLVRNVRMYLVVNRNLHELYEKLTDIPFVTEDKRPILACFFCCAKLQQCYRFLRKCLEAEQLFAQMMIDGYKPNPLINQNHLEYFGEFIKSPTEIISIVDGLQTECIATKEELPTVCEGLDDIIIIDSEEEHQRDGATVAKKPELETRRTTLEDAITAEHSKNENSDSKVIRTTQERTSKPGTYFKEPHTSDQHSFNRVNKNTQQTRTKIGEKPHKCDVCPRSFSRNYDLTKHIRIHTGERPYKCDVCPRSFSRKARLTQHFRIHTGETPYKCDVCPQSFSRKTQLTQHIRKHTGETPYKCDICQRSFSRKDHLTCHVRIHTGENCYKCDICQHSFSRKNHLIEHIRIHSGEKPYKCDVCPCSFTRKTYLTQHSSIHSDEKPYKCDLCLCTFSRKTYLTQHIHSHNVCGIDSGIVTGIIRKYVA